MAINTAQLLEGKILAQKIQDSIRADLQNFANQKLEVPQLAVIQVGDHSSADWYVGQQEKLAAKLGLLFQRKILKDPFTQEDIHRAIRDFNQDKTIHGIFMTMPLPQGYDSDAALFNLDSRKDVEGIHPTNLGLIVLRKSKIIPCTAFSAFRLIESTGVDLRGKTATIVGQSAIVGRPLQMLLGEKRVTTIVCNSGTSAAQMEKFIAESDIVVGCAGQPGLIKGNWIKQGAIVIDVGTTEVNGRLVGDTEFEAAKERASFITPVPGGVGPLTVTMLMQNLIQAYRWQKKLS